MFGYGGTEIGGSGVENPGRKSQEPPRLQMPGGRLLLYLVGLRAQTVLLHGALQEEQLAVLQVGGPHQVDVVDHQVGQGGGAGDGGDVAAGATPRRGLVVEAVAQAGLVAAALDPREACFGEVAAEEVGLGGVAGVAWGEICIRRYEIRSIGVSPSSITDKDKLRRESHLTTVACTRR
jgi:hypothetical protein